MIDLADRRVLITGGSGDIGHALCSAFASHGARVAFTWFMNHDGMERSRAVIEAAGREAVAIRVNQRDRKATAEIGTAVDEAFGGLDVLIHNAATGVLKPTLDLRGKDFSAVIDVNARALLELAQRFTSTMPAGGRILGLSSAGAVRAIENYAAIGASKAAMEAIVRHLAMELGPRGITANVIRPGVVDTRALDHFPNREQLLDVARFRTPNGRIATPTDVANVALLLTSPLAAMIQGQVIDVDGGYGVLA